MNLDELERLEREATAGPWSSTPSDPSQGYECFWITACPEINQEREIATVCGPQNERNTSNAALIAALRNSSRELIADARRMTFLEERGYAIDMIGDPDNDVRFWFGNGHTVSRGRTLRAAIDAAIAQEQK